MRPSSKRRWWPLPTTNEAASCARSSCSATGLAPEQLKAELQDHVKEQTAPYKYPRIVEFAPELPKTASGKVKRALLRKAAPRVRP